MNHSNEGDRVIVADFHGEMMSIFNLQRVSCLMILALAASKPVAAGPLFVSFDPNQFPLAAKYESAHAKVEEAEAALASAQASQDAAQQDRDDANANYAQAVDNLADAEANLVIAQMTNDPDMIQMAEEAVQLATDELQIAETELLTAEKQFVAASKAVSFASVAVRKSRAIESRDRRDYEDGALDQQNPLLPNAMDGDSFVFNDVMSGRFVDPPTASGFEYTMLSSSLFTQILGFPTGFSDPFTVSAEGTNYGQFNVGETLTFDGGGVSSFTVTGINPLVDPTLLDAFPLQLEYNTPTASFTMTPINSSAVPEPTSLALLATGAFGFMGYGWRRKRKPAA